MRYAEFRDRLEDALQEAGLFFAHADRRVETIDLDDAGRSWKVYVHRVTPQSAEPFHVSAVIGFRVEPPRRRSRAHLRRRRPHGTHGQTTTDSDGAQVDAHRLFASRKSPISFNHADA
jgi:type VI protein secretion system component VasA